jgi:hypothetical protein
MLFSRYASYKADFLRFFPKIQQITFRFWCMNLNEKLPQNAGNRISEVLDFKISSGSMQPKPLQIRGSVDYLTKTLDPLQAPRRWIGDKSMPKAKKKLIKH